MNPVTVLKPKPFFGRDWHPEMPELLGLYHAYVKGFNKVGNAICTKMCFVWSLNEADRYSFCQDVRHHKLFIIVSGGCHMLSDKFYNLSVDVASTMRVVSV